MSQFSFGNIDETTVDGFALAAMLEQFEEAVNSMHAGATAPSYAIVGMPWRDTSSTPHLIKIWTGGAWVTMGSLNTATGMWTPYIQGAAIAVIATLSIGQGLENSTGALRVKLKGSSLSRDADGIYLPTLLTPGSFTSADITVDEFGRITAAANGAGGGVSTVGQAEIRTATGGGYFQFAQNPSTLGIWVDGGKAPQNPVVNTSYLGANAVQSSGEQRITIALPGGAYSWKPMYVQGSGTDSRSFYWGSRYVTASPPYDLGDGEVAGFAFLLLDAAGEVVGSQLAESPPWAYNGPTSITPDRICAKTGKKYKRVAKKRTFEEFMDGSPIEYEEQEITHAMKNADMPLLPHPFVDIPTGGRVVMLDPMCERIHTMLQAQEEGYWQEIAQMVKSKYRKNNKLVRRKGPQGVMIIGTK